MISAWWLLLIVPVSAFSGVMLMSILAAAKCADCKIRKEKTN